MDYILLRGVPMLFLLPVALAVTPDSPDSELNDPERSYALRLNGELGSLLTISNQVQFDKEGTYFDYVRYGGQDTLFLFARLSADLDLDDRHTLVLLYQPLDLQTSDNLEEDLLVDDLLFPAGSSVDFRYGFDFVRASWLWDAQEEEDRELAFGLSMQIRSAVINFRAADGSGERSQGGIGPVPILKFRTRQPLDDQRWWGFEADGFYAPVSYLNGDNNEVIGAILDASGRYGLQLNEGIDAFLNLRYLGGGSEGFDDDHTGPGDGYVRNWVHFTSLSLGFQLR